MTSDGFPPHEDEHPPAEGEGEWISNEPPVDDFGDPAADGATVSEGDEPLHDEQDELPEDIASEDMVPVDGGEKKKFPLVLLVGAVGSLIVVGALGYWQFGGHRSEPSMLDVGGQPAPAASMPSFASKPAAPVVSPAALAALDVAPTTGFSQPSTTVDAAKTPEPPVAKVVESAVSVLSPAAPQPAVPAPTLPLVAPSPTPAMGPVVIPPSPNGNDARLTVLSSRIDDLQKVLAQATEQLGQISDKLSSVQTGAVVPAGAASSDPALQERLNKLEQKMLQMEQHRSPRSASVEDVYPSKTTIKPKTTHTKAHSGLRRTVVRLAPIVKPASQKWILRAASPEEAWIAKDAQTRELRPVHVGDSVPGVGKITAILQRGDTWSVQATNGVIR
jgi:intracellular multiplication protein IcmG